MITVSEGFDDAWETEATGVVLSAQHRHRYHHRDRLNLPEGVELRFPATVTFTDPDAGADTPDTWATLTLSGDCPYSSRDWRGWSTDRTNDGSMVTYDYTHPKVLLSTESNDVMDSFSIPITVVTGDIASGDGGIADIWAILSPEPDDDDEDIGTTVVLREDRGDR